MQDFTQGYKLLVNSFQMSVQAGANMIVSGTGVVKANDPAAVIGTMRSAVDAEILRRKGN